MTYGTNLNKLIMKIASYKASKGGIGNAFEFFSNPEKREKIMEESETDALLSIELIKASPDNPYGNDDEAIAGRLLDEIIEKENKRWKSDIQKIV